MILKAKLYFEFYKSTLILNLASSILLSFMIYATLTSMPMVVKVPPPFAVIYIRCCMFGGPLVCFYQKEITRKNEYYFYFNKGISKINLLIVTLLINILIGVLVLNILHYAKLA
jgi:hypothetical protein